MDAAARDREFRFTPKHFDYIRKLVSRQTGIVLADAKQNMVYSRLSRRVRTLGLDSFDEYCEVLRQGDEQELVNFVNAITTNLTAFFRENHHFEFLANKLLPQLMQAKAASRRLRIWSAGCSTGEEPYSIAMVLREVIPARDDWDVKILATDLDSNVVDTAHRGVYAEERVNGLGRERLRRWFRKGHGANAGKVRVSPELQELITFKQLNLMHGWPLRGPFDLIFCRNVVIYFDKATQKVLFDRYADLLDTAGHLFIGHSESLYKVTDRFENLGNTIYRKRK